MLREMAELGMAIARKAAGEALRADPESPDKPGKSPDPGLTFARATFAARQAMALETRIAAGDPAPGAPKAAPAPDPRRPVLRQALYKMTESGPGRAQLRRHIDERIEDELLADPEHELPLGDALAAICNALGLHLNPSQLPDELLGLAPSHPPDRQAAHHQAPQPHRDPAPGPDPPRS